MALPKNEITDNPIVQRIVGLMEEQGKRDIDLMNFLGTPQSLMSKWKYEGSNVYLKYIVEIAEFLKTTPNYLFLGTVDTGEVEGLTPMENDVLRMFRELDDGRKRCLRDMLRYLSEGS